MHTVRLPQFHCSALADSSNTQVGSIGINCDSNAQVGEAGYSGGTRQALCVELRECCFDLVCAPSLKMVSTVYTSRTVSWGKGSILHCRTRRWVPPCFIIEFVPRSNIVSNIVSLIPDPCPSLMAKLFPTVSTKSRLCIALASRFHEVLYIVEPIDVHVHLCFFPDTAAHKTTPVNMPSRLRPP